MFVLYAEPATATAQFRRAPARAVGTSPYHSWLTAFGAAVGAEKPGTRSDATSWGERYCKALERTCRQFNVAVFTRLDMEDGRICHEEHPAEPRRHLRRARARIRDRTRELSCSRYSNPSELCGRLRRPLADAWG